VQRVADRNRRHAAKLGIRTVVSEFRELYRFRELLYMITWRNIRIKYKQSVMGFLWALFMPMIIVSAGILIKYAFATLSNTAMTLTQVATVSVKALPWSFFVSSLKFATNSLTANTNLVTKIYFPREIFPISAVFSQLFDFIIASAVLTLLLTVGQIGISVQLLWVPVLLILLILLVIGLGTLFASANLFFRDVKYLVEVVLTFGIFFTPVFYEAEMFGQWKPLLLLNPVAPILEALNQTVVLHHTPELSWVAYSAIFAVSVFAFAYRFFKKLEPGFAESI